MKTTESNRTDWPLSAPDYNDDPEYEMNRAEGVSLLAFLLALAWALIVLVLFEIIPAIFGAVIKLSRVGACCRGRNFKSGPSPVFSRPPARNPCAGAGPTVPKSPTTNNQQPK